MLNDPSRMLVKPIHLVPPGVRAAHSPLALRLRAELRGDVLFDNASRGRYATDASIYQIMPIGIVVPRDQADLLLALDIARDAGAPLLARGAGSSQCGQTVAEALVIDTSKWLNNITAIGSLLPLVVLLGLAAVSFHFFGAATQISARSLIPHWSLGNAVFWSSVFFAFGGVEAGSAMLKLLPQLEDMLKESGGKLGKVVEYTSYPEAYQDLALGRVDYVVNTVINVPAP